MSTITDLEEGTDSYLTKWQNFQIEFHEFSSYFTDREPASVSRPLLNIAIALLSFGDSLGKDNIWNLHELEQALTTEMGKLHKAMLSAWSSSEEWVHICVEWKTWQELVGSGVLFRLSPQKIGREERPNSSTPSSQAITQASTTVNHSVASVSLRQPSVQLENPQHEAFLMDIGYSTEETPIIDYRQTPAWYLERITAALPMIEDLSVFMGKKYPTFLDALYYHLKELEEHVAQKHLDQECLTDAKNAMEVFNQLNDAMLCHDESTFPKWHAIRSHLGRTRREFLRSYCRRRSDQTPPDGPPPSYEEAIGQDSFTSNAASFDLTNRTGRLNDPSADVGSFRSVVASVPPTTTNAGAPNPDERLTVLSHLGSNNPYRRHGRS